MPWGGRVSEIGGDDDWGRETNDCLGLVESVQLVKNGRGGLYCELVQCISAES